MLSMNDRQDDEELLIKREGKMFRIIFRPVQNQDDQKILYNHALALHVHDHQSAYCESSW